MIKQNPTINDVINELMFIAIAKPEKVDVTVEYSGVSDSIEIKVMPTGFDYLHSSTEVYKAAMLLQKSIHLDFPGALKELVKAHKSLLNCMNTQFEVAA